MALLAYGEERLPVPSNVPDLQYEQRTWEDFTPGSFPYKQGGRQLSWRYATSTNLETWQPRFDVPLNELSEVMARKRHAATGYFRTVQDMGRWWLVDPGGKLFLSAGVNNFRPAVLDKHESEYRKYFTDEADWAQKEAERLRSWGFNTAGCWSNAELLRRNENGLAYTIIKWPGWEARTGPLAAFSIEKGIGKEGAGNRSYTENIAPVFHPEFAAFVHKHAPGLARYANDRNLLGYFLDNEIPPPNLMGYLLASENLPGHEGARDAAESWLASRGRTRETITPQDHMDWPGYVFETYCRIVVPPMRKYDPNHLILGPRLHSRSLSSKSTLEAVGKICDVVCVHPYGTVIPEPMEFKTWGEWSGRPVMITEHYAKGADVGMRNASGAGVTVPNQEYRGRYYQGFVMACLASRVCVGWHWHQYRDLKPTEKVPSYDTSVNKGIVRSDFTGYDECLKKMKSINEIMYAVAANHLDESPSRYTFKEILMASLAALVAVGVLVLLSRALLVMNRRKVIAAS